VIGAQSLRIDCAPEKVAECEMASCGENWAFEEPAATAQSGTNITFRIVNTVTNRGCGKTLVAVRTWEAIDAFGNRASCSQKVRVVDTIAPSWLCAKNQTVECGTSWAFASPAFLDVCGTAIVSILSTVTNPGCGAAFTATRTWQATDDCGNASQCSQTVTVRDTQAPTLRCAPNRTVECGLPWSFEPPTGTDVCNPAHLLIQLMSTVTNSGCGGAYSVTRTWEAVDGCSNRATCSQTLTVADTTPPTLTCAPAKSVEWGDPWSFDPPQASDACSANGVTISIASTVTNSACGGSFTAIRTWLASDACGNRSQCSQQVTVLDTRPPTLLCAPARRVECGSPWTFDVPVAQDECSPVTLTGTGTVTNAGCGGTFSVSRTWQAADACGNRATCSQTVSVVDTTPPLLRCAPNKTVECGAAWSFDTPSASGDACDTSPLVIRLVGTLTNRTCGNTFVAARTWEVADACGNRATCSQTVTVADTTPPTITCAPDRNAECGLAFSFEVPQATDTCSDSVVAIRIVSTTTNAGCGGAFTAVRTWEALDACGNLASCSQRITLVDTTPPSITCVASKATKCGAPFGFDLPEVLDTCSGTNVTLRILNTVTNAGCDGTFTAVRTWEAVDGCGNRAACSQTVSVVDADGPMLVCANAKTVACGSTWTFDAPTALDRCCGTNVTVRVAITATNAGCGGAFTATRTWEAFDVCGNRSICIQVVSVVDAVPPRLTCLPDKSVECGAIWSFDRPSAIDDCSGTNVMIRLLSTVTNAACGNTFVSMRTWEAVDSCTNRAICSQVVTVVDTTAPTLLCAPAKTVECGVFWAFDAPSAIEGCGLVRVTIVSTVTNSGCGLTLTATRTWRAEDECGNTAICSQTVGVLDLTPPTLLCPLGRTADCMQLWVFDQPSALDSCGPVTTTVLSTVTNATGSNTYTAVRTWLATDACGNQATCSQAVTVHCGPAPMSLGNRVWNDANNNGVVDLIESGLDGVQVTLVQVGPDGSPFTADDVTVENQWTANGGYYLFTGFAPGRYFLVLRNVPVNYPVSSTSTDSADNQEDNDDNGFQPLGNGTLVFSPVIEVSAGEADLTLDFGLYKPTPTVAAFVGLRAFAAEGGLMVEWETASEWGTVGYLLYRLDEAAQEWAPVTADWVLALNGVGGGVYQVLDTGASLSAPNIYVVLELQATGEERSHGPYTVP
jgi:hypothetical protein